MVQEENVKITYNGGLGRGTEIDFAMVGGRDRKHIKEPKTILGEYQKKLLVIDLDDRNIRKEVKSYRSVKRRAWKLEEVEYRRRIYDLVNTDDQDIWKSFKSGVLNACDEVCGKRKGRAILGNGM